MNENLKMLTHRGETSGQQNEYPDWKLVDEISVTLLELDVGRFETLQRVLPSVVLANIQRTTESPYEDGGCTVSRLLKLFRIAQLQLEHLLRSQKELLNALEKPQKHRKKATDENRVQRQSALSAQRRDDDNCAQFTDLYKCNECSKIFMNSVFLYEHLQRRHAKPKTLAHGHAHEICNCVSSRRRAPHKRRTETRPCAGGLPDSLGASSLSR